MREQRCVHSERREVVIKIMVCDNESREVVKMRQRGGKNEGRVGTGKHSHRLAVLTHSQRRDFMKFLEVSYLVSSESPSYVIQGNLSFKANQPDFEHTATIIAHPRYFLSSSIAY